MTNICVFAGTTEGRKLVEFLSEQDCRVTACVATEYGQTLIRPAENLTVMTKRLDDEQMAAMFQKEKFDLVVDATHPYARVVTDNICKACGAAGMEYLRLLREESDPTDDVICVPDIAGAVGYLNQYDGNILLTTGSKELHLYTAIRDFAERVYPRVLPMHASLTACEDAGVKVSHIIAVQGPFTEETNVATLKSINAAFLVTKDGGSTGGFDDKASAARKTGARLVVIGRPPQLEGMSFSKVLALLKDRYGFEGRQQVTIVGIGPGNPSAMTKEVADAIASAQCLIGAKRMIEAVRRVGQASFEAISPDKIAACIQEHPEYVSFTVVMSGDSGFFSGTKKLLLALENRGDMPFGSASNHGDRSFSSENQGDRLFGSASNHGDRSFSSEDQGDRLFGSAENQGDSPFSSENQEDRHLRISKETEHKEEQAAGRIANQGAGPYGSLKILPGLSSLSYMCARLGVSYENVKTVSVHGRKYNIVPDVRENELVFILTGGDADIKEMCRALIKAGICNVYVNIAERLSYPDERILSGTPKEMLAEEFDKLSVVMIQNLAPSKYVSSGLPDAMFTRGEGKKGLIPMTKSEVRAICLSKLGLRQDAVCWDVGAGTGSVSIEMALLASKGKVYAVEKNEDALLLLEKNKEKFMTDNLEIVPGEAPSACMDLPAPTHVFIGGSSGTQREIIELAKRKNPDARIVATAIALESSAELGECLKEFGNDDSDVVCVNISASKKAGPYHLMMAQNPIYIYSF